jgi:hypothetical protein
MLHLKTGVSKLSQQDMKQLRGGEPPQSCTYTYQGADGKWKTESGTCSNTITEHGPLGIGGYTATPYCHTTSHTAASPLSSNGGTSVCGSSQYYANFLASWL